MKKNKYALMAGALLICLMAATAAQAHVPYLERFRDYSFSRPYAVQGSPDKSIAVYAWLRTGDDVDVYRFQIGEGETPEVFIETLVPVCAAIASSSLRGTCRVQA